MSWRATWGAVMRRSGPGGWARLILAVCMALLTATPIHAQTPVPTAPETMAQLASEDFEGAFVNDEGVCPQGNCNVPKAWGAWFVGRREKDPDGTNLRPQYIQTNNPRHVKTGAGAQRTFVENGTFTGGLYRMITGVKVGAKLRFTVQGSAWSTNDENPISSRPSRDIRLRIGIDPQGGDNGRPDPTGAQVIWSQEQEARDAFAKFSVEAEARSTTIIVYTFATMRDVLRHNEAFWDDALVETVVAIAPTPAPTANVNASPTPAPTPTLAPSPTPKLGKRYVVKSGDTLLSIAIEFKTTVDNLRKLNRVPGDILQIGQELIIEPGTQDTAVTPTPAARATAVNRGGVPSGPGELCLEAFFDRNGNGLRDEREDLVPGIGFTVNSGTTLVRSFTSNGVEEPDCIKNLAPGNYRVAAGMPSIYIATTPLNNIVNVTSTISSRFSVGLRRVTDGNRVATAVPQASALSNAVPGIVAVLVTVVGALLIFGAISLGVNLLLRRRRI